MERAEARKQKQRDQELVAAMLAETRERQLATKQPVKRVRVRPATPGRSGLEIAGQRSAAADGSSTASAGTKTTTKSVETQTETSETMATQATPKVFVDACVGELRTGEPFGWRGIWDV